MGAFILNYLLPLGMIISFIALLHCLVLRRGVAWFLVTLLMGPLGGLFYFAGYWNMLPFRMPKALQATPTATRRCPRCQQLAELLHEYEDGRQVIRICQMCKSELQLRHSDFSLPT